MSPTYDFICENCGEYEYVQRISDDALTICPHCGGKTQRQIGLGGGIIFNCDGFYHTDYKRKKTPKDQISKDERVDKRKRAVKKLKRACPKTKF